MADEPVWALVSLVVGFGLSEVKTWASDRRRHAEENAAAVTTWRLGQVRDTRLALRNTLAGLEAVALGDVAAARRFQRRTEGLSANIALVGDVNAVRAYRELIIELRGLVGRDRGPDYILQSTRVSGDAESALDRQEERLLKGELPHLLTVADDPDLFNLEGLVARVDPPILTASVAAREARFAIDLRNAIERLFRGRP